MDKPATVSPVCVQQLELAAVAALPTRQGAFDIRVFVDQRDGKEHVALVRGDVFGKEGVLTRLHSECLTGDVFASIRCDCREQAGLDTVDANLALGFPDDQRDYGPAAAMLRQLGVRSVRLLTNNPDKIAQLERCGTSVTARVPHVVMPGPQNRHYLETKTRRSGHLMMFEGGTPDAA
jgi:GTP cyclohydrolase II